MCFGHPLDPNLMLNNLIDIWLETVSDMGPVSIDRYAESADGGNFVMKLTYRRSIIFYKKDFPFVNPAH